MTVMGDASMEGLSDRGSIPLRSISKPQHMREKSRVNAKKIK